MEINKNNYEAYFLDSIEGNLSASLQKELELFLNQYPELKAEFDDFELIELEAEIISNDSLKAGLIREESTGLTEQDYLLISELEGTISKEEKEKLNVLLLANPNLKNDRNIYHKTRLSNQEQVVFPNKSSLLRKKGNIIYFLRYSAAAAAAILAFVWFNFSSVDKQYNPRIAQKIVLEHEEQVAFSFTKVVIKEEIKEIPIKEMPKINDIKETPNYAQIETPQKVDMIEEKVKEEIPVEIVTQVLEIPVEGFAQNPVKEEKKSELTFVNNEDQIVNLDKPSPKKNEFIPLNEFAKKAILKDKTVSEVLSDEIAELSNDKINFESIKNKQGKIAQYALNIGKLSITRKK